MDGASILAFSLPTDIGWEDLRKASKDGRLTMPCCGVPAVPKTFHAHGTRFFAHKVRHQDCDWQGESEDHERLKTVAAQAAIDAGATAETEVSGPTWRADVMAEVAGGRFAIEIQLSAQTTQVTKERTQGYQQSGVEVLWFMRLMPRDMTINENLRVLILPEHPGAWEEFVARNTKLFVRNDLVWDTGWIDSIPVTLIGFDVICQRCGEIWHYTSWQRVRYSEISSTLMDEIETETAVPDPWAKPRRSDRPRTENAGRYCPNCRATKSGSGIIKEDAALYPWHYNDRTATRPGQTGWRARWAPGNPRPGVGDVEAWEALLQERGLLLDPRKSRSTSFKLRHRWEAEQDEEREQMRQRRLHLIRLADDVARGAGRVKVAVERDEDDEASIRLITFSFPYHKGLVAAIKRTFRSAKFNPDDRTWVIEIGYLSASGALKMAKGILDHLRAGNWPGDDGRFAGDL